jgi:hypothetical protein
METTSKSGIQYIIEKKTFENSDSFHEKCWNITNIEPKSKDEFQKVYMKCQLKQNEIELNCKYEIK